MIEPEDIPEDWKLETVGSISSEIRTGGTPKKSADEYWDGNIPWKASKHFHKKKLDLGNTTQYITEAGKSETTIANEGEVLLVCRGAHTGKVGIAREKIAFNQDVKVIRLPDTIIPKYVGYYLMSQFEYFKNMQRGGTTKGITTSHVRSLNIPVPSFDEQKVIVERLEKQLGRVKRLEQSVQTVRRLSNEYEDSIMAYTFANRDYTESSLTSAENEQELPESWKVKKIKDVVLEAKNGGTPKRSNDEYWGGEIGWLSSGEVTGKEIFEAEESVTRSGINNTSAKVFPKDSVLVAMYGATRAQSAIVRKRLSGNQAICCLVPDQDIISEEYLLYYLKLNKKELASKGRGGGQNNINQSTILEQKIPVPPLREQKEIVNNFEKIDFSKIEKSSELLNSLFNEYSDSILMYAFQGKLTNTDNHIPAKADL